VNNLLRRTITGIVFIVLIMGAIFADQQIFSLLFLFITILGLWEFYTLVESDSIKPNKLAGTFTGAFIFASNAFIALGIASNRLLLFGFLLIFFIFLLELYRKKSNPFTNISYTFLGLIYVAIPFSLLNYFPNPSFCDTVLYNKTYILGFFYLVWVYETSAYVVGTTLGRKKLFRSVSPNKSWEGMIGGLVFTLAAARVISYFYTDITTVNWLVIALIIVGFGTYGDLFESMLKRSNNAKDSGRILPGHGGILDRFDGVLFATPFVFAYLLLIT